MQSQWNATQTPRNFDVHLWLDAKSCVPFSRKASNVATAPSVPPEWAGEVGL